MKSSAGQFAFGFILTLALVPFAISGGDKLSKDDRAMLNFWQANIRAGILKDAPASSATVAANGIDPTQPPGEPKAGNPCGLLVQGRLSPQGLGPMDRLLTCDKKIPHLWWYWTNSAGICSGDIITATWDWGATNNLTAWPAMILTGQGEYTNGFPWGPIVSNVMMAAKCLSMTAVPFLYCPEGLPDQPMLRCSVRCSPWLPIDMPLSGPPPAWATNRLKIQPSTNGTYNIQFTNWGANLAVDLMEAASIEHPKWQKIGAVKIGANGSAITNVASIHGMSFYAARLAQ